MASDGAREAAASLDWRAYCSRMLDRTHRLWEKQFGSVGDRRGLFRAVADVVDVETVLYPGSYVDLTPSLIWRSVTYVDVDRRANQFFTDTAGVEELLAEIGSDATHPEFRFIHADYSSELSLPESSFDLLISLYAGFVSEHCTQHLRVGGCLLVNPSHGDAAMASIDDRYELRGAVVAAGGSYRVDADQLDTYLVPKRDNDITAGFLRGSGRGVAYTRSPFAYLFERVR